MCQSRMARAGRPTQPTAPHPAGEAAPEPRGPADGPAAVDAYADALARLDAEGQSPAGRLLVAIGALRRLGERTERWHAAIEAEHAERLGRARAEHEAALAAAQSKAEQRFARLETTVEERRAELDARSAAEREAESARFEREMAGIAAKYDAAAARLSDRHRESSLSADTALEGTVKQADGEVERIRRQARAHTDRLDEIEAQARRLAGPRVAFPVARRDPPRDVSAEADAWEEPPPEPSRPEGEPPPLDQLAEAVVELSARLRRLAGPSLHGLIRVGGPVYAVSLAFLGGVGYGASRVDWGRLAVAAPVAAGYGAGAAAVMVLVMLGLRALALRLTRGAIAPIAAGLLRGRDLADEAVFSALAYRARAIHRATQRHAEEVARANAAYAERLGRANAGREAESRRARDRHGEAVALMTKSVQTAVEALEAERGDRAGKIEAERGRLIDEARGAFEVASRSAERGRGEAMAELESSWRLVREAALGVIERASGWAVRCCPPWEESAAQPPELGGEGAQGPVVSLGRLSLSAGPDPGRIGEPVAGRVMAPSLLDFPGRASLVLSAPASAREPALGALRAAVMRVLAAVPAGKARLVMIDPVGLGRSFAGFMRLADHDERLVGSRVLTEPPQIERRLAEVTAHIETVIQKYLRNEFESIEAYNRAAGEIAEPYRFLVIADFPTGFTAESARRLRSILESGPRCGVFAMIHADRHAKPPEGMSWPDLRAAGAVVQLDDSGVPGFIGDDREGLALELDAPPPDELAGALLDAIGARSLSTGRVELPFAHVAPAEDGLVWTQEAGEALRVALGRSGARRVQHLELGRGTSQHVLIAGKTGSGKSTLLHVMITGAALWHSPAEVELYLVDFKKGVEFRAYAADRLPHARAVAVESDREFGLSVLRRLDEELERRGRIFREHGAQSIAAARRAAPGEHLPRVLLIIDEFQEFFTEDDPIAQDAALLLDRLVRQGRAFGVHVILGSQTLSGAYALARSTVGQMAVRIALQCSETDSYLILSEDNAAARLLNRPGEAIYNDQNGLVEGNNPFQVAWLPDLTRDEQLRRVRERADREGWRPPAPQIVFEGAVAADPGRNPKLEEAVGQAARASRDGGLGRPAPLEAWLGEPVAIKDPTAAVLRRQVGANLLLVGQQDETLRAMLSAAAAGLVAQLAADRRPGPRLVLIDGTPADDRRAGELAGLIGPLGAAAGLGASLGGAREAGALLAAVAAELERREAQDEAEAPALLVFIHGLQRVRTLRKKDDDFSFSFSANEEAGAEGADAARAFSRLLREGPGLGVHVIATIDTVGSLERTLDRHAREAFEQRVVLQMSAADSSALIDSSAASKLGMNRALLYVEEQGSLEKFRPYGTPSASLLARVAAGLRGEGQ